MSRRKSIAAAICLVALITGCGIEQELKMQAKKLNKLCPQTVDSATTLERVEAGPGKKFTYIYSVTMALNDMQKKTLASVVRSKALATKELKRYFDKGVVLWYRYNDKQGNLVTEFSVKR